MTMSKEIRDVLGRFQVPAELVEAVLAAATETPGSRRYLGGWAASDLEENYLCTTEEADEWLQKHEMAISESACPGGWSYIEDEIPFPRLDDCFDCECGHTCTDDMDECPKCGASFEEEGD